MLNEKPAMKLRCRTACATLVVTAAAVMGCTTQRNPRYCGDGVCTDPAYPFCDVTGMFGDLRQQCVAIDCTPDDFVACRGDDELRCNATGTNYDVSRCALGCDDAGGCRLCEPNQTACTNGRQSTCDAAGNVVSTEACPLGCFEDQPRCRELAPSNGLEHHMDMAVTGPSLVVHDATLHIPSGLLTSPSGSVILRGHIMAAPQHGVPIQVFPVRSLTIIGKLEIRGAPTELVPAVAFVAHEDVRLDGAILLLGSGPDASVAAPPPGSIISGPCVGGTGTYDVVGQPAWGAGGGGGGGATQGGAGGSHWKWPGSPGGAAFPNPGLVPLRGGCRGGTPPGQPPTHGGGAIQISSRTRILLGPNSTIQANGVPGFVGETPPGEYPGRERTPRGGGSGGGILLEAPAVILESGVMLTANGGAGASGDGVAGTSLAGPVPSYGGACTLPSTYCTDGGHGGSSAGPGRTAASIPTTGLLEVYTGAGGGAVGHIRINTRDGVYTKASDTFESPGASTGAIATR
jgi:hypothetical protein